MLKLETEKKIINKYFPYRNVTSTLKNRQFHKTSTQNIFFNSKACKDMG